MPRRAGRARGADLLRRYARALAAQHELLDLAGRRLGQLGDEVERLGALEVRELGARELAQLVLARGGAGAQDHERVRALAPLLARHADDGDLLHRGVAE